METPTEEKLKMFDEILSQTEGDAEELVYKWDLHLFAEGTGSFSEITRTAIDHAFYDDLMCEGSEEYWLEEIQKGNIKTLNDFAEAVKVCNNEVIENSISGADGFIQHFLLCVQDEFPEDEVAILTVLFYKKYPDFRFDEEKAHIFCELEWE